MTRMMTTWINEDDIIERDGKKWRVGHCSTLYPSGEHRLELIEIVPKVDEKGRVLPISKRKEPEIATITVSALSKELGVTLMGYRPKVK